MEDFTNMLNNVEDSYYSFVAAVLTYVKKKQSRLEVVKEYIDANPKALSSDILKFISEQDDFYDDAALSSAQVL